MERFPRSLVEALHRIMHGRGTRAVSDTVTAITARAFERFEPGLDVQREWREARKAQARGIRLLKENLSPGQRAQYENGGYFDVVGGDTGRRYRIRTGIQANIQRLDKRGRPECYLCFMPEGDLVVGDVLLAQKLALELFESQTLEVANIFTLDDPIFTLIH